MKSFKSTAWLLPQPVLIIGTYDRDGKPNAMNAAWGGQWDMHEIIISLGSHQTTDNLAERTYCRFYGLADTDRHSCRLCC
jgi:flavin reductase (DIM6/NTAB) family NADH-FMN oxidoreductase RutF